MRPRIAGRFGELRPSVLSSEAARVGSSVNGFARDRSPARNNLAHLMPWSLNAGANNTSAGSQSSSTPARRLHRCLSAGQAVAMRDFLEVDEAGGELRPPGVVAWFPQSRDGCGRQNNRLWTHIFETD